MNKILVTGAAGFIGFHLCQKLYSNSDSSSLNPNNSASKAPYKIYNIGNNQPVPLLQFIEVLERCLGKKAHKDLLPMQPGDVPITYADISELESEIGFRPTTSIETGISRFVECYYSDYKNS